MSYAILPQAFPYLIEARPSYIRGLVDALFELTRTDVPNGSSFAVTVDGMGGTWRLWLSESSYKFLEKRYTERNKTYWQGLLKKQNTEMQPDPAWDL